MKHKCKIDETPTVRNPSYLISPVNGEYAIEYYQDGENRKATRFFRTEAIIFVLLKIPENHQFMVVDLGEVKHES